MRFSAPFTLSFEAYETSPVESAFYSLQKETFFCVCAFDNWMILVWMNGETQKLSF